MEETFWNDSANAVSDLADRYFRKGKIELLESLQKDTPPALQRTCRRIETVALYYSKISNGGAENVVAMLAGRLSRTTFDGESNYKVVLITDEPPTPHDYHVPPAVVRVQLPNRHSVSKNGYRSRAQVLTELIDEYKIDAFVYSLWVTECLPWDMLCIKASPRHPAFVVHCHGSAAMLYSLRFKPQETLHSFALADGIVCLSKTDKWYWGHFNSFVRMIPNPINVNPCAEHRASWGGDSLLWVGRLSEEKQPIEAVKILEKVLQRRPNAHLTIVGEEKDCEKGRLVREIETRGLCDKVSMVGFTLDVERYYQNATVLLVTSRFEGFSLTLFEAASFGLPIVMYDLPQLTFCEECDGWKSVKQGDFSCAAEHVNRLLEDENEWQGASNRLFDTCANFIEEDPAYEWNRLFNELEDDAVLEVDTPKGEAWLLSQMAAFHSQLAGKDERNLKRLKKKLKEKEKCLADARTFRAGKATSALKRSYRWLRNALRRRLEG